MQQKRNKMLFIFGIMAVAVLTAEFAWRALSSFSLSSRFGQAEIRLPSGKRLYVKRESWGLHTQRLAISQNSDPCVPGNQVTDYIDDDADAIIYSVDRKNLRVYEMSPPFSFSSPEVWQGDRPVFVNADDWWSLYYNPKRVGAVALDVPLNALCLSHLWSPVSSLRPH